MRPLTSNELADLRKTRGELFAASHVHSESSPDHASWRSSLRDDQFTTAMLVASALLMIASIASLIMFEIFLY
jgi:hypothetical protein